MKRPAGRLDQLLPSFSFGDAIGNHVLALQGVFRRAGYRSDIFARLRHPKLRHRSRDYAEYLMRDGEENVCFFHFSIGSSLSGFFSRVQARKVLIYHNVTPERFMRGVNRQAEFECRRGREELRELAGTADLALAVSEFNRRELAAMGYANTAVLPVILELSRYDAAPAGRVSARYGSAGVNVLHVGRFVPNKKIEDVVKSFAVFKRIEPRARLFLVGTDVGFENYSEAVGDLAGRLGVADVHFPGHVNDGELAHFYRMADVYLSMSEHEGFCVPLLEAMHFGVPVVAFRAAAVPETVGDAGLLVGEKRYEEIAELMSRAVGDEELREALVAAGRRRLETFAPERIEAELWKTLRSCGLVR